MFPNSWFSYKNSKKDRPKQKSHGRKRSNFSPKELFSIQTEVYRGKRRLLTEQLVKLIFCFFKTSSVTNKVLTWRPDIVPSLSFVLKGAKLIFRCVSISYTPVIVKNIVLILTPSLSRKSYLLSTHDINDNINFINSPNL